MNGFQLFVKLQAITLHFTSESYDYFKYEGKWNAKVTSYELRRDRLLFELLAKKLPSFVNDVDDFIVANLMASASRIWIHQLLEPNASKTYYDFLKYRESFEYLFRQDCKYYLETFGSFEMTRVNEPVFSNLLYSRDKGHYQSLIMMREAYMPYKDMWKDFDNVISDTIYWPKFKLRMNKCFPFLKCSRGRARKILDEIVNGF